MSYSSYEGRNGFFTSANFSQRPFLFLGIAGASLVSVFLFSLGTSASGHSCSVLPFTETIKQGESSIRTVTITPSVAGSPYMLRMGGLPIGVQAILGQASGIAPATSSLTFIASPTAQTASFGIALFYDEIIAGATSTTHCIVGLTVETGGGPVVVTKGVAIDIKPNVFPNTINLGSGGVVQVAILSGFDFNATDVDPLSVTLASAPVKLKGNGNTQTSVTDVNGDGKDDIVVHILTEALELSATDVEASLEGETRDGIKIRGMDSIRVVP